MSAGRWLKTLPCESGQYWVATRDGLNAGLATVVYDEDRGALIMAGKRPGVAGIWKGWWWSERIREPLPPPPAEWGAEEECDGCRCGWPIKNQIHLAEGGGDMHIMRCLHFPETCPKCGAQDPEDGRAPNCPEEPSRPASSDAELFPDLSPELKRYINREAMKCLKKGGGR